MLFLGFATPAASQAMVTPGFAFLGSGYDLLSGNPLSTDGLGDPGFRAQLFDWTYTQNLMTTDGKYKIADTTQARTFDACSTAMQENMFNSAFSYKHLIHTSLSADLNLGNLGGKDSKDNVDLSFGVDVRNVRNHTDDRSRIYAHVTSVCTRYQLMMGLFDVPNATENFKRGLEIMPEKFDMDTYAEFLTEFGTHYVSSMKVGGRWGMQMTFTSDSYQALLQNDVNVHAGITFVAGSVNGGIHLNTTNDRKTTYQISNAIYKNSSYSIGGEYSPDAATWMKSVAATPMPVHLTLTRLDKLLNTFNFPSMSQSTLTTKAKNLVTAINSWCHYHEELTPGFNCTPQAAIPMPTPGPIAAGAVRRVCVENSGGFLIQWQMIINPDSANPIMGEQSDHYAVGSTECIDGTDVLAKYGDYLGCTVDIVGGGTVKCGKPYQQYNVQSHYQANYKCTGLADGATCKFNGVTAIGAEGGEGGRRRRRRSPILEKLLR